MNTCEFGQLVSAYVDGELTAGQARNVEEHLKTCAPCRGELAEYRALRDGLGGAKWPEMSQMGLARVHRAIENEVAIGLTRMRRVAVALAGMAASLAVVTTVLANRQAPSLPAPSWQRVAALPSSSARSSEESNDEMAVAQWVVADLGGVEGD